MPAQNKTADRPPNENGPRNAQNLKRFSRWVLYIYVALALALSAGIILRGLVPFFIAVALIASWANKRRAPPAEASHHLYLFRTSVVLAVGIFFGLALRPFGLSGLALLLLWVWAGMRLWTGFQFARANKSFPRPMSLTW